MFGFLTPVRSEAADPLKDLAAAQLFWQSLPKDDPTAARHAVCKALAESVARVGSSVDRLQAVLAFDKHARVLFDELLANEVAQSAEAPSTAIQSWQAALELCRCFGRAYNQFLRLMRDNGEFERRRDCQALVLLRLFRHRKRELLLRLFSEEGLPPFSWKEIHEAYRFAQSRGLLRESLPVERNHSPTAAEATLEREYVHLLIQDLMNGGNFSPGTASWVSHRIPRWSARMVLTRDRDGASGYRFVVDAHADAGLVRSNVESPDTCLRLDMAPLLKCVRDEIASLSDMSEGRIQHSSSERRRRLRALQKVNALCAAERPVLVRRGERTPTALTVDVVMGLPRVLRAARNKSRHVAAAMPQATEDATVTAFAAPSEDTSDACPDNAIPAMRSAETASPWRLTMVDQSVSGCCLHGPALAANPIIPGALIAFRLDATAPWNLAVVRRVRKRLAGRRVEIGVEHIGKDPQSVVVVLAELDARFDKAVENEVTRVAGLYIPESTEHPLLPIKTLILPGCGFSSGDRLLLRAGTSVHSIRLKEPLEERTEFIWSPFDILDRGPRNDAVHTGATLEVC